MTATGRDAPVPGVDLTACDREPIHTPGSIQPHGALLVLAGDTVAHASANLAALVGRPGLAVPGCRLIDVLGPEAAAEVGVALADAAAVERAVRLTTIAAAGRRFDAVAHRRGGRTILELELVPTWNGPTDPYPALESFAARAEAAADVTELCNAAAAEVRRLTGFDRVLVYRFDDGWNGTVVGEARNDRFPSYMDHRFPASDIPAQARELYRRNRVRLIPDAGYAPVPVGPAAAVPLDLSFAVLRSVSPVHVEYMRNMGTAASMSVSVILADRLWGLISCHHRDPRAVPFTVRATCDLLARALSLRLAALVHTRDFELTLAARSAYAALIAAMADRLDYAAALAEHPAEFLAVAGARGAAVLGAAGCTRVGETPPEGDLRGLADWLFREGGREVYATDSLPAALPPAEAFKDTGCGVLAASVSKVHPHYVLWFRPEVIRDVKWGGDPTKPAGPPDGHGLALHPRRSFDTWRETVRLKSAAWRPAEVEAAAALRNAIVGVVLRRAEELADLNAELQRSNKELEAFSYSVSHDLRAPLRHVVGYAEMLREGAAGKLSERDERCITTIIESSEYAGVLVDKLLAFSRLGRGQLSRGRVDVAALIAELVAELRPATAGRTVTWEVGPLPVVEADLMMFRLAVRNLLENALKYTRSRSEAVVVVGHRADPGEDVFFVRDNGVGFDMKYGDKLFGVFQRLHRMEDFEGTGIGLANMKRVIDRHGGRVWAEGEEGRGATFFFTLPRPAG